MRRFYFLLFIGVIFFLAIETGWQFKVSDIRKTTLNWMRILQHAEHWTLDDAFKVHDSTACILECLRSLQWLRSRLCYSQSITRLNQTTKIPFASCCQGIYINSLRNLSDAVRITNTVLMQDKQASYIYWYRWLANSKPLYILFGKFIPVCLLIIWQ